MVDIWEKELLEKLLKRNKVKYTENDEDYYKACDQMLAVTEGEIQKEFTGFKSSMGAGNLESESLRTAMLRLYIKMRRRRTLKGMSDHMKRAYDTYIIDVLKLLFLHLEAV